MIRKPSASLLALLFFFVTAIFSYSILLTGCGSSSSSTTPPPTGEVITPAPQSTPQSVAIGQLFTILQVTVTNNGAAVGNVTVTFTAPSSGASGTFAPNGTLTDTETTNQGGVATAGSFQANSIAGNYSVTASVSGVSTPATFVLTNLTGIPATVAPTGGTSPQTVTVGAPFTALQALVLDSGSNPISGVVVTFNAPTVGASAAFTTGSTPSTTATATTNSSGVATAPTLTANTEAGAYTVTATVAGVSAPANFSLTNQTGAAATITATSGSGQSTTLSSPFPLPLQATVTDADSNPVSGASVTFTAFPASGGASGTFANGTATYTTTTGANGVATSTTFTANASAGTYLVAAATAGATAVDFTLSNVVPVIAASGGTPQSATVGTAFGTQLQALVTETTTGVATPVSGVKVTFTAPASGASGKFADTNTNTTTAVTNVLGVANAAPFTANSTAGSYSVTGTAPGTSGSASFSLTNTAAAPLAPGNYVFSLSGSANIPGEASYPYSLAGVFSVNTGGIITGGELDFVNYLYADSDQINPVGSTIAKTSDGNLQFTLVTCDQLDCSNTDINAGVDGVITLDASFLPLNSAKAFVIEFDSSASSSGTLDLQTSTAAPASGGYAFGVNGLDTFGDPIAIGGVIAITSPGTISGTGSIFDANDDETIYQQQTFAPSTVSTPDSFGRIEFTLNPGSTDSFAFPQIVLAGYVVDADHIRLVETVDSFTGDLGGTALSQGTNTGGFDTASVSGKSYVVGLTGSDAAGALQAVGLLTLNSGGTVTGFLNYNDLTGLEPQTPSPITHGTYTVASTGDVTLTGVTDGKATFNFQLYLDGNGDVMAASMDTADVLGGLGYQQTGSFSASSFTGDYALNVTGWDKNEDGEFDAVGPVTATGTGDTFAGTVDLNWLTSTPVEKPDLAVSGTFTSNTDGIFTGTITGLDVTTSTNKDVFNFYLIDANGDSIALETDTKQLTLGYFAQQ